MSKEGLSKAAVFLAFFTILFVLSYGYWYYNRPLPEAVTRNLFQGVLYERIIIKNPRPVVAHFISVDLDAPGIGFLVTPEEPAGGRHLRARKTSSFLREFGVRIAVNGGFFEPWYYNGPLSYYPHTGDPVDVYGFFISGGKPYSTPKKGYSIIYINEENEVSEGWPKGIPRQAMSGYPLLINDGKIRGITKNSPNPGTPEPRTAIGFDRKGEKFFIIVIDGRQPNYSEGMTLKELALFAGGKGADTLLNLDGGGSSTLVAENEKSEPVLLNSPIHGRVPPGRERPVANHLGIFAERLPGNLSKTQFR